MQLALTGQCRAARWIEIHVHSITLDRHYGPVALRLAANEMILIGVCCESSPSEPVLDGMSWRSS